MPTVINKRDASAPARITSGTAVYIGRPTKWGNPFIIGKDGTRAAVIGKYAEWFATQPQLHAALHELHGRDLVCWCSPDACHGDILLKAAAAAPSAAAR